MVKYSLLTCLLQAKGAQVTPVSHGGFVNRPSQEGTTPLSYLVVVQVHMYSIGQGLTPGKVGTDPDCHRYLTVRGPWVRDYSRVGRSMGGGDSALPS